MHFQIVLSEAITIALPHNVKEDQVISALLQKIFSYDTSPLCGGHKPQSLWQTH